MKLEICDKITRIEIQKHNNNNRKMAEYRQIILKIQ